MSWFDRPEIITNSDAHTTIYTVGYSASDVIESMWNKLRDVEGWDFSIHEDCRDVLMEANGTYKITINVEKI